MPSRDHRERSSELFNRATYPLARKVSFEEAYPDIDKIKIHIIEYDYIHNETGLERRYDKESFPGEYIDCTNRYCFHGGFSLGEIIRAMYAGRKTSEENRIGCRGNETSPKGKKIYKKCLHTFQYIIEIQYKPKI